MYLVCGEALFDVFIQSDGARGNEMTFKAIAGGSPFNVALGLRRMGADSALFTGISSDSLGQRLRQVLRDEGVSDAYLVASDAPTTLAMVGLDANGSPQYSFRGEGCADRLLRAEHLPALDARVRGLHVGSFSLVVEPVASTLLQLVAREHQQRLISLDPNVRLGPAPDIAHWRERVETFALLYPERDPQQVAASWLNERCQLVFLTHGSAGASVHSRHGHWTAPAVAVLTRDTVGAGDTFQAALLSYLARHHLDTPEALATLSREQIDDMLRLAIEAAALTCSRVGPDLPYLHELDRHHLAAR
jgi:fructokinase